jgi:hypothetical protein
MKVSYYIGIGALCVGLVGCGGSDHNSTPAAPPSAPAPPESLVLTVNDVYSLTKSQSETDDPRAINKPGGTSISGTDDTSDSMAVD